VNFSAIHSIWTVLLFIAFVAIAIWAFSGKRKKAFDDAARQPLNDDVQGRTSAAEDRMSRAAEDSTDRVAGGRND
jgi:cytochrome c oxidase cbb3-type subunit 4